jgi:NADH-quinone oxidoreductase subunit I
MFGAKLFFISSLDFHSNTTWKMKIATHSMAINNWLYQIGWTLKSLGSGLGLTWKHIRRLRYRRVPKAIGEAHYFMQSDGPVTIKYPQEQIPVPDVGRYRLFMETDDCIGCDQCARICPVDCITIEKIKAVDVIGSTSDGTKKRFWLPTFDIDHAKCCFCGLCTTVCPTECLIMTRAYDYSEYDRDNFNYHFGNLNPEEAAKKQADYDAHEAKKAAAKRAAQASSNAVDPTP